MKQLKASIWAALLLTAACSQYEDENAVAEQSPRPVTFDTYLAAATTRAPEPLMDRGRLEATGFGVFAAAHSIAAGDGWENKKSSTTQNFMYNQLVSGSDWSYSPLKYWPNELKDDGHGATTEGKEGLSFFAYAPYIKDDTSVDCLGINHDPASTGDPAISYTAADYPNEGTDLLWATMRDQEHPITSTNEKVKFSFHHACVRLGLKVKANPDAEDLTNTKILIESVTIAAVEALQKAGKLNLNSPDASRPQWTHDTSTPFSLTVSDANLNFNYIYSSIKPVGIPNSGQNENGFSARTRGDGDALTVAQQFAALKAGVTTTAGPLLHTDGEATTYYYTLVPRTVDLGTTVSIPVTITYHVITLDSRLPSGFSDIKNTCTANATLESFSAGTRYTLLLSLGLNSIKAEATATSWNP